jgi:hypothetical protein
MITRHLDEIKAHIEEQMKRSIDAYDFAGEVKKATDRAIDDAVKDAVRSFFSYGKGSEAIRDAVRKALESETKEGK